MKTITMALALSMMASTLSYGAIFKKADLNRNCNLYFQVSKIKNAEGKYVLPELKDGESLVSKNTIYNMSLVNVKVDFDGRKIDGNLQMNRTLAFNRIFKKNVHVRGDNKTSEKVINFFFNKVCVNDDNEIVYADLYSRKGH